MPPQFGPIAHTATIAHHFYPHPGAREAGQFDLWSLALFFTGGDEVALTSLRQWCSTSMPTAPVGDSHLLVWHPDPVLHPMHCAYGCPMSQRQRPAGGRASGETQVEG